MDPSSRNSRAGTNAGLLETLGAELMGIIIPVSACMLIVVLLVRALVVEGEMQAPSIAMLVYDENPSDSDSKKLLGALLNALAFVAFITLATFLLVGLFYCGFTKFLKAYTAVSTFLTLFYMGGALSVLLIETFYVPIDVVTLSILLFNFAVLGTLSIFPVLAPMPILFAQVYLVLVAVLIAFWFAFLPEWTTWVMLLAMAAYDVAAVLLPAGPLNLLVQLAMERNEQLPALVYEARPSSVPEADSASAVAFRPTARTSTEEHHHQNGGNYMARITRLLRLSPPASSSYQTVQSSTVDEDAEEQSHERPSRVSLRVFSAEEHHQAQEEQPSRDIVEESIPLVSRHIQPRVETLSSLIGEERAAGEAIRASEAQYSSATTEIESTMGGGIKLGLGDFVFYSVLVGRAAMFDLMTVYACYLAIVAGLAGTLALLAVWRRALPALPISISLGVVFYFLTRLLMDPFVVQLATHLVFF